MSDVGYERNLEIEHEGELPVTVTVNSGGKSMTYVAFGTCAARRTQGGQFRCTSCGNQLRVRDVHESVLNGNPRYCPYCGKLISAEVGVKQ